jgi:hypothetical protein
MTEPLPPETLDRVREGASREGAFAAQMLLHLLERMDALEARDKEDANNWARLSVRQTILGLRERIEALEQRPIPGFVDLAAPTPEAAPVATDEELVSRYSHAWADATRAGHNHRRAAAEALRVIHDLGRQYEAAQPPAAQPAPAVAAIRAALERLVKLYNDDTHALLGSDWDQAFAAARAALAQSAPVLAPIEGLVERVEARAGGDGRAAIREVAAWLNERGYRGAGYRAAPQDLLEQEADR